MGIQTGKRFRCRAELCTELGQFLTVGIAQASGHALLSALGFAATPFGRDHRAPEANRG